MDEFEKIWKILERISKEHEKIEKEQKKLTEQHKLTEKSVNDLSKSVSELSEEVKKLTRELKGVTDGWGRFVEGFMAPSAEKTFRDMGYITKSTHFRRVIKKDGEVIGEIDIVIPAYKEQKILFVGEAKTFVSSKDIDEFIENIKNAKEAWEEYEDYKFIGFIGGMNWGEGADIYALRQGLYIFKVSDEQMKLILPKGFKPKLW